MMTRMIRLDSRPSILARSLFAASSYRPRVSNAPLALWRRRRRENTCMTIGLLGLFGCGNSGNDGSLEAMLIFLRRRRPNAKLVCFCGARGGAPDQVARTFGVAAIPLGLPQPTNALLQTLDRLSSKGPRLLASWLLAIKHARSLDVLIIPGTGILDDFGERPTGMPATLFGWCLAAKLCGTRIAFVSIGAGPIHHPLSRWLMRSAVAMAQYRSYRDHISKAFLQSIGFDTRNDEVYPDIAFKLPEPAAACVDNTGEGPLTIGVGVMTYVGWRNDDIRGAAVYVAYLEKITKFVLWLLDRGHQVRILTGDGADRRAVADVMAGVMAADRYLSRDRLQAQPTESLHELMRQIAATDIIVATRFHNIVCALKLAKPTVSIGYAEKNDVLMAEMGLGSFCQHVERLDLRRLTEQFTELAANRRNYERSVRDTNLLYQERLEQQDSRLESLLLDSASKG
jgi:polysaccharide pyruvyl transferase WcaK-like protein